MPHTTLTFEGSTQQFYQSTAKRILINPPFQEISLSQLPNNALALEEKITIQAKENMEPETPLKDVLEKHPNYNLELSFKTEDNHLYMYRKLELKFDKSCSEEDKKHTLKQINALGQQTLLFKKNTDQ
jgi:hypothetical protein